MLLGLWRLLPFPIFGFDRENSLSEWSLAVDSQWTLCSLERIGDYGSGASEGEGL